MKPFSEIPGPKQIPFFGNALSFVKEDRLEWIASLSKEYGSFIRLKLFGNPTLLIQDPELIRYILQSNYDDFNKEGRALEKGKVVLGNGLFTNAGDHWRKQRRLAQPAFYRQRLEGLSKIMVQCIEDMLARWEKFADSGEVIDISNEMMHLTLDVVTRTLFTSSLTDEELKTIETTFPKVLRETNRRLLNPLPVFDKIPTKESLSYSANIKKLDDILFRIINNRKKVKSNFDDLLGMLMSAVDEETGEGMDDRQLRDEVMTILIAGHETTAQALCWSLLLLHKHPDAYNRHNKEVQQTLGTDRPGAKDFMSLSYTLQVFKESMRLYPPIAMFLRNAACDMELNGYSVAKDTRILIPPYMLHHDPEFWDEPEQFKPERFTSEAEKARPRYVYFPFGGGPRICIGNNFAMMEAVFTLAMITQRFRVEPIAAEDVKIDFTLTLRPKGGLPARVKRQSVIN